MTAALAARLVPGTDRTVVSHGAGPSGGRSEVTAASGRLGYRDEHVYEGGKTDRAAAGLPSDGSRAVGEVAR